MRSGLRTMLLRRSLWSFPGHRARLRGVSKNGDEDMADGGRTIGQHSQDEEHLLQGQGVPQAHRPQGHAVQGRQGTFERSRILSLKRR